MQSDTLLNCISSLQSLSLEDKVHLGSFFTVLEAFGDRCLSLEDRVGPFGLLIYCVGGVRRQENVGIMWTSCMA